MSAFAFADSALAYEAVAALLDAYGMYYGVGSVYDVTSPSGVGSSFEKTWNDFNSFRQNNSQSTYDIIDVYHYMQGEVDDQSVVFDFTHSSGKFAGFYIDQESAQIFDEFWNWLLTGPAQMTIVDNQWSWTRDVNDVVVPVPVSSSSTFNGFDVVTSASALINNGATLNKYTFYDSCGFWVVGSNNNFTLILLSTVDTGAVVKTAYSVSSGNPVGSTLTSVVSTLSNGVYYKSPAFSVSSESTVYPSVASFTLNDVLSASGGFVSSSVTIEPYESPNGSSPNPLIPIVSDPDYSPVAVEIITDVPWDNDDYGDVFPLPDLNFESLVSDITDSISANDFALLADPNPVDPDPVPPASEVFTPIFTPDYPSFNFNFSGIWHYVREWVQSLGSWFSIMFSVWASLPFAMVVPVYATAVVVIVLGVYRRFFM